jgi:hypothetical protein
MKFMLYTTDHQLRQRAVPRGLRLSYTLNEELMVFTLNQILLGQYNEEKWNGGMVQAWERRKLRRGFRLETMKYRDLLRRPSRRWENDIKTCREEIILEVVNWT